MANKSKSSPSKSVFLKRPFLFLVLIVGGSLLALQLGIDKKIVALASIFLGLLTQAFAAFLALLALIPWVGPFIVSLLSVPFFWIVNAVSNLLATVAVKQGYGKDIARSKLLVLVLSLGMILGYIMGNWFPIADK